MWLRNGMGLLAAFAILTLVSCDYGHKPYQTVPSPDTNPAPMVIEVDDYGRFWNREMVEVTLQTIDRASLKTNTVVLVFIHGWHHNADPADPNFQEFQKTLSNLRNKLVEPTYIAARKTLGLKEGVNVIGLYVGWRGRSLPWFFDYLTFWGRKSAAETVGDGDLREFFVRLQKLYIARNRASSSGDRTFMGLVTVGHSFGGQVLFKAVTETFERDLIDAMTNAGGQPDSDQTQTQLGEIVSGFGDMTVLLNPALEAFQYERIHRLTQKLAFNQFQAPVLLTVSAEDDSARKFWFPIGRNLNLPFRPSFQSDEEKQLWITALGEYVPQQTHTLELTEQPSPINDTLFKGCKVSTIDFTAPLVLGGAELRPKSDPHHAFSPVIIAVTGNELVQEHNGIFGATFSNFLADYIAFVEGKRMCLRGM